MTCKKIKQKDNNPSVVNSELPSSLLWRNLKINTQDKLYNFNKLFMMLQKISSFSHIEKEHSFY